LKLGREYVELGVGRNSQKLTTVVLGRLINTNANVILLQLYVKYYILLG